MRPVLPSREVSDSYLTDRCCLTCGFRGRELQGRRGADRIICPQCRQDLYSRRPRSYAEMEGLVTAPTEEPLAASTPARRRAALLQLAGDLIVVGWMLVRPSKRERRARREMAGAR